MRKKKQKTGRLAQIITHFGRFLFSKANVLKYYCYADGWRNEHGCEVPFILSPRSILSLQSKNGNVVAQLKTKAKCSKVMR